MGIRPFDSFTGNIGAHRCTVHRKVSTLGMTPAQKRPANRIRRLVHITCRGFLGRHRTPERHVKVFFPAHNRTIGPPEGKITKPRRKPERHGCKLLRRHHIAHSTIAANVHATVARTCCHGLQQGPAPLRVPQVVNHVPVALGTQQLAYVKALPVRQLRHITRQTQIGQPRKDQAIHRAERPLLKRIKRRLGIGQKIRRIRHGPPINYGALGWCIGVRLLCTKKAPGPCGPGRLHCSFSL